MAFQNWEDDGTPPPPRQDLGWTGLHVGLRPLSRWDLAAVSIGCNVWFGFRKKNALRVLSSKNSLNVFKSFDSALFFRVDKQLPGTFENHHFFE